MSHVCYVDEIEFDEPEAGVCGCCGATQQILTRYIKRGDQPFAIYKALLTSQHRPRVEMIIGFGKWDEAEQASERTAFTFELCSDEQNTNVTLVDEESSAWSSGFLGIVPSREEALRHPFAPEVFTLAEHILRCDELVKSYLG